MSLLLVVVAVCCVSIRVNSVVDNGDNVAVAAAVLTMSKGSYNLEPTETDPKNNENTEVQTVVLDNIETEFSEDYYNSFAEHKNENQYPIYTKQYTSGGTKYKNFYVKNSTNYDLNIGEMLNSELGFEIEDNDSIQVLIYHTHTCESYIDKDVGYYYESYYPRTTDNRYNVTQVGEAIAQQLRKAGIGVIHDTTIHDTSYNGSYSRSRATVDSYIKKYPTIKVTLDVHRDSIGTDEYKVKPTFTYNGKQGAQIMIMSGYDANGSFNFPNWNYNLRFALQLQQTCETNFKGITRPLSFGNFAYNMNVNTGSLLVEVGTDSNTLEEAVYSGELLGKSLAEVLQNNI